LSEGIETSKPMIAVTGTEAAWNRLLTNRAKANRLENELLLQRDESDTPRRRGNLKVFMNACSDSILMPDIFSKEKRSEIMSKIKSSGTKIELAIKTALIEKGIEFEYQPKIFGKARFFNFTQRCRFL
jgi:hypothetical protein